MRKKAPLILIQGSVCVYWSENYSNFSRKTGCIGVILCWKSIARTPKIWKCFFDTDSGKKYVYWRVIFTFRVQKFVIHNVISHRLINVQKHEIFREARAGESAEVENEPNGVIVEEPQTVETSFMNGNLHKNEQEIPKPVKDPVKRLSIDGQITSKISKNKVRMC